MDRSVIARLGQGVGKTGRLHPDAIARALAAFGRHVAEARSFGADPVAVGTSALRDATNREDFLTPAATLLGRPVRILTGEEEATLTYRGALLGLPPLPSPRLVIDIGGGSTELVLGEADAITSKVSLQIGAVRLTEQFVHSNPPSLNEQHSLRQFITTSLRTTRVLGGPAGGAKPPPAIGVAGTATTLAAMDIGLTTYDPARVHGHEMTVERLEALVARLLSCTTAERAKIPGVEPGRAEVLPAGALILLEIVRRANVSRLTISDRGLRWGVLSSLDSPSSLL